MSPQLKRSLSLVVVIFAGLSFVMTLSGTIGLWALRGTITSAVTSTVSLISDTLDTTDQALNVAQGTLDEVQLSFASLIGTVQSIAMALRDGQPAVTTVVRLVKQDLPTTIDAAHGAITSAAQTAKGVDDLLNQLAKVPLINLDYRPAQPLADSIAGIGATLDQLPTNLQDIGNNLETLSGDLTIVANQVDGLRGTIQRIDTNLRGVAGVVRDYEAQLARARSALQAITAGAESAILAVLAVATFGLIWLMILQGLLVMLGLRVWRAKSV